MGSLPLRLVGVGYRAFLQKTMWRALWYCVVESQAHPFSFGRTKDVLNSRCIKRLLELCTAANHSQQWYCRAANGSKHTCTTSVKVRRTADRKLSRSASLVQPWRRGSKCAAMSTISMYLHQSRSLVKLLMARWMLRLLTVLLLLAVLSHACIRAHHWL